jgi:hypothetical protein
MVLALETDEIAWQVKQDEAAERAEAPSSKKRKTLRRPRSKWIRTKEDLMLEAIGSEPSPPTRTMLWQQWQTQHERTIAKKQEALLKAAKKQTKPPPQLCEEDEEDDEQQQDDEPQCREPKDKRGRVKGVRRLERR